MSMNWRIEVLGDTPSTQDIVHTASMTDEPEGYVLQAMQQSGARGRHGNKWDAPMGNLYLSALLRPKCTLNQAGQLSFVVGVALSNAMDQYIDASKHKKTLKWPNDILVDGLKISGILLESNLNADGSLDSIVAGVGVNIFKAPDLAINLAALSKEPVYINVFRDEFLAKLGALYETWQSQGFAPIRDAWLEQAHGLNQPMTVRLPNEVKKGIFGGIDEGGALLLKHDDDSLEVIQAGVVHFTDDI